jgi:hypothetical protein
MSLPGGVTGERDKKDAVVSKRMTVRNIVVSFIDDG